MGAAMLASCSEDTAPESAVADVTPADKPSVSFSIKSNVTGSRADENTLQSAEESAVTKLLVVVFNDPDGENNNKVIYDREENTSDTFLKVEEIQLADQPLTNQEYIINFDDPAPYQLCFIANPSDELAEKIKALTPEISTVGDFKTLTEEDGEPEGKPMLMTSGFYGIKALHSAIIKLGEINLVRAMARIDIVCATTDVTVNEIKFKNRTVKSNLIADRIDVATTNDEFLETEPKVYTIEGGLTATMDNDNVIPGEYKEVIYSYEQYFNEEGKEPVLEISYDVTAGGEKRSFVHIIDLKDYQEVGQQSLHLKRNTLYNIRITGGRPDGNIAMTVSVADWTEGTILSVSKEEILDGCRPANPSLDGIKVGDYFLEDGTYLPWTDKLSESDKQKIVGVVVSIDHNDIGAEARKALDTPHGLVLAIKPEEYKNHDQTFDKLIELTDQKLPDGFSYTSKQEAMKVGNDGYAITQKAFSVLESSSPTDYALDPFFYIKNDYNTIVPGTTGWYLPSLNEITQGLAKLLNFDPLILDNSSEGGAEVQGVRTTLDKYFLNAGSDLGWKESYEGSGIYMLGNFLTSTPYSNNNMFGFELEENSVHFYFRSYSSELQLIWPMLAF